MKRVCAEILKVVKSGGPLSPELNTVSLNFIRLQQHRHSDVESVLTLATDAFIAWRAVSAQDAAQDYLLQMFLPKWPSR